MTSEQIVTIISGLIVVGLVGFFLYQLSKSKKIELTDIAVAIQMAMPLAQKIEPAAKIAVMAAEEFGRIGKLQTSEEKLAYAVDVFHDLVPASWGVTEKMMLDAIHSAVPYANAVGVPVEITHEHQTVPPVQG